jgi:hypothetical protein
MPEINQLTAVTSLTAADQVPVFSSQMGDARKASMTVLGAFLQTLITSTDDKITQYASPSATGFTVVITDDGNSKWLVLTPIAGYAAGTITLPSLANCTDKQEVLVNSTQSVTTLTVGANGSGLIGAPTTLAANGFFRLRFDAVQKTWYRVG